MSPVTGSPVWFREGLRTRCTPMETHDEPSDAGSLLEAIAPTVPPAEPVADPTGSPDGSPEPAGATELPDVVSSWPGDPGPGTPESDAGDPLDSEPRDWLRLGFSIAVVACCCAYIFWVVHPELIFRNTTPTGGDMGSHVWGPAYLRDHLLPNFRVGGWTPDWYNGFPVYTFYMVVPSLAIVMLDVGFLPLWLAPVAISAALGLAYVTQRRISSQLGRVVGWWSIGLATVLMIDVPYNVAFKLIAVSGLVMFPFGAWWLGRGLGLRFGGPELMAIVSVPFLMDRTLFHIYGGNIASTMAGEFAFSISITFGLFFLGSLARLVKGEGGSMAATAALGAMCALCHAIPMFYVAGSAIVLIVVYGSWRGVAKTAAAGVVAGMLASFWYLPFYGFSTYLNDMGWEKLGPLKTAESLNVGLFDSTEFWRYLLPFAPHISTAGATTPDPDMLHGKAFFVLAAMGILLSLVSRLRAGWALTAIMVGAAAAFRYMPQMRFWNARVLPLYYLCIYFLAAIGVYLLVVTVWRALSRLFENRGWGTAVVSLLWIWFVFEFGTGKVWPYLAMASDAARVVIGLAVAIGTVAVALGAGRAVPLWTRLGVAGSLSITAVVVLVTTNDMASGDRLFTMVGAVGMVAMVLAAAHGAHALPGPKPVWVSSLRGGSSLETSDVGPSPAVPALPPPPPELPPGPVSPAAEGPVSRHVVRSGTGSMVTVVGAMLIVAFVAMSMTLRNLPGGTIETATDGTTSYRWAGFESRYFGVARLWADYNFRGLEDKVSGTTNWSDEYFGIVDEVERVGKQNGCGRVMWEYDGDRMNNYGTPMAFMMFPYFTDGCMGSQEGLYFEASSTTPFHFLMQSELSAQCSCAQRFDIMGFETSPYTGFNLDRGIGHMQLMGIRYYMADSEMAVAAASADDRLTEVGRYQPPPDPGAGAAAPRTPYVIYEVADAPLVRPLTVMPEVWENVPDDALDYIGPTAQWFLDPDRWDIVPATDGPDNWPRNSEVTAPARDRLTDAERTTASQTFPPDQLEDLAAAKSKVPTLTVPLPDPVAREPLPKVKVSNVATTRDGLTFDVDKVGVPVMVNISYFPNWTAEGADGPWRAGANQMIVVPTSKTVTLSFGRSFLELGSTGLTLAGIVGAGALVVVDDRRRRRQREPMPTETTDQPLPT